MGLKGLSISLILLLCACNSDYQVLLEQREKQAQLTQQEPIVVGISWSFKKPCLIKGAEIATEEFNYNNQLHRKIHLELADERSLNEIKSQVKRIKAEQKQTYQIARSFANNLDVVAVIGHRTSSQAIQASVTYENYGILFLAPTATHLSLTNHGFNYVFQMMPNNEEMGIQLANYFHKNEYKRVAVLYERSLYAEQLADIFIQNASDKFKVVFERSFFKTEEEFIKTLSRILAELVEEVSSLDAIFIVTDGVKACKIIEKSRELNIQVPFIGSDSLFSEDFEKCSAAEETVVPILVDKTRINNFEKEINAIVAKETQKKPQKWPEICLNPNRQGEGQGFLLGYDAIKLLAHAFEKTETTAPLEVANYLRYMSPWKEGLLGDYSFQENGRLERENPIYFAILCPKKVDDRLCQEFKKNHSKCFFTKFCSHERLPFKFSEKADENNLIFTILDKPY